MKKKHDTEPETVNAPELRFTKRQLLTHKKYRDRADILGVILHDGTEYTDAETAALLHEFMKGKVKG